MIIGILIIGRVTLMAFSQVKYNKSIRGIAVGACKSAKRRSKVKGIPFNLTSISPELLIESFCMKLSLTSRLSLTILGRVCEKALKDESKIKVKNKFLFM